MGGLGVGVTWVIILASSLLGPLDFGQHGGNSQAAGLFRGVEKPINAADGGGADIHITGCHQTVVMVQTDLEIQAGADGWFGSQKVFQRVGHVLGESLFVALEQGAPRLVNAGGIDTELQVGIFSVDAALAFGRFKLSEVNPQRANIKNAISVVGLRVAVKQRSKMPPALRPETVHFRRRHLPSDEAFVLDRGHVESISGIRKTSSGELRCS